MILIGIAANRRGRKAAMIYHSLMYVLGGVIVTVARNIYWIIMGRLILGIASGAAAILIPLYLGEVAPPTVRGLLGTISLFALVSGVAMANLLSIFISTTFYTWRYYILIIPIIASFQLILCHFLMESPRWLLSKDPKCEKAKYIIKKLRGFRNEEDILNEVDMFLFAVSKHKTKYSSAHSIQAMYNLLIAKDIRLLIISVIILQITRQFCGSFVIFYYSTDLLQNLIPFPSIGTFIISIFNIIATFISLKLLPDLGRRTLILSSVAGMAFSCGIISLSYCRLINNYFALIGMACFVISYQIGIGPIPWLIIAEMFDSKYVSTTVSMAYIINYLCNFIIAFSFPFLHDYLRQFVFIPYGIYLILAFITAYFFQTETFGRSVQEIQQLLAMDDDEYMKSVIVYEAIECLDEDEDNNNEMSLKEDNINRNITYQYSSGGSNKSNKSDNSK